MSEMIVYQVRSIDAFGNAKVVHAYATQDEANDAIATMRSRTGKRYTSVPVPNQPDQYWGINIRPTPLPPKKK